MVPLRTDIPKNVEQITGRPRIAGENRIGAVDVGEKWNIDFIATTIRRTGTDFAAPLADVGGGRPERSIRPGVSRRGGKTAELSAMSALRRVGSAARRTGKAGSRRVKT